MPLYPSLHLALAVYPGRLSLLRALHGGGMRSGRMKRFNAGDVQQRTVHEAVLIGIRYEHSRLPYRNAFRMTDFVRFATRHADDERLKRSPEKELPDDFSAHDGLPCDMHAIRMPKLLATPDRRVPRP